MTSFFLLFSGLFHWFEDSYLTEHSSISFFGKLPPWTKDITTTLWTLQGAVTLPTYGLRLLSTFWLSYHSSSFRHLSCSFCTTGPSWQTLSIAGITRAIPQSWWRRCNSFTSFNLQLITDSIITQKEELLPRQNLEVTTVLWQTL